MDNFIKMKTKKENRKEKVEQSKSFIRDYLSYYPSYSIATLAIENNITVREAKEMIRKNTMEIITHKKGRYFLVFTKKHASSFPLGTIFPKKKLNKRYYNKFENLKTLELPLWNMVTICNYARDKNISVPQAIGEMLINGVLDIYAPNEKEKIIYPKVTDALKNELLMR